MANNSFQAQVDKIVVNTQKRMMLVIQQSIVNAINEMQKPVAKGGNMRVDTGFLRASGQASLNGMPTGLSRKPDDAEKHEFDDGEKVAPSVALSVAQLKYGVTFFYGWTANYAKHRELHDGFRDKVLQNWQTIVDSVVAEAKRRFSK